MTTERVAQHLDTHILHTKSAAVTRDRELHLWKQNQGKGENRTNHWFCKAIKEFY